jgi:hypothetical protein
MFGQNWGRRRRAPSCVPRVEELEARHVLSVSVSFIGGTITITGDKKNNSVVVQDGGNLPGAVVTVFSGGAPVLQVPGDQVFVYSINLKDGNDSLVYNVLGPLNMASRNFPANLGNGNDTFNMTVASTMTLSGLVVTVNGQAGNDSLNVTVNGDITQYSLLALNLYGSDGNDRIGVNAETDRSGTPGVSSGIDVDSTATFNVLDQGGNGKDTLGSFYFGQLDGVFNSTIFGNAGNDTINGRARLAPNSGSGPSPPLLVFNESGGNDKDSLTMLVNTQSTRFVNIFATLDGGSGNDTCNAAGTNVPITVISC